MNKSYIIPISALIKILYLYSSVNFEPPSVNAERAEINLHKFYSQKLLLIYIQYYIYIF